MADLSNLSLNLKERISRFVEHLDSSRIEVRTAPKRTNRIAYVTLTPIGVRPGDKIIVIANKEGLLVFKGD